MSRSAIRGLFTYALGALAFVSLVQGVTSGTITIAGIVAYSAVLLAAAIRLGSDLHHLDWPRATEINVAPGSYYDKQTGLIHKVVPTTPSCKHADAVEVKSLAIPNVCEAEVVAWWCASCETQLPADFDPLTAKLEAADWSGRPLYNLTDRGEVVPRHVTRRVVPKAIAPAKTYSRGGHVKPVGKLIFDTEPVSKVRVEDPSEWVHEADGSWTHRPKHGPPGNYDREFLRNWR